jgi:hypothetical protein
MMAKFLSLLDATDSYFKKVGDSSLFWLSGLFDHVWSGR